MASISVVMGGDGSGAPRRRRHAPATPRPSVGGLDEARRIEDYDLARDQPGNPPALI